jgi:hypothetical protein
VQLAGHRLAFAPEAEVQLRFRRGMWETARQFYRYGRAGAQVHRAFRHAGMSKPDNRHALARWRFLLTHLSDLWESRERRGHWVRMGAYRTGRLVGSVRERAVVL